MIVSAVLCLFLSTVTDSVAERPVLDAFSLYFGRSCQLRRDDSVSILSLTKWVTTKLIP